MVQKLNGTPQFQGSPIIKALEAENAQLRQMLASQSRLERLIEAVAGGVATNPSLSPEEVAHRALEIVGRVTNALEAAAAPVAQ